MFTIRDGTLPGALSSMFLASEAIAISLPGVLKTGEAKNQKGSV
jgi:hypothetical protein